jgi:hypothetical protein
MSRPLARRVLSFLPCVWLAGLAHGQVGEVLLKPGSGGDFGASIALHGTRLVIGDPGVRTVHVYDIVANHWFLHSQLRPRSSTATSDFGRALALSPERLVIGAPLEGAPTNGGRVYILRPNGSDWQLEQKLQPADLNVGDQFGASVAVSGDWIVAGAPFDDDFGGNSGSARVYRRVGTSWSLAQELHASDAFGGDFYGNAVAIDGTRIVVGARSKTDHGAAAGGAYVYEYDGSAWQQTAKLSAAAPQPLDFFGWSLALHGKRVLVGAPGDDQAGLGTGAAYVFDLQQQGWTQSAKLMTAQAGAGASFGASVALDSDQACIGAYSAKLHGQLSGSAYLYGRVDGQWKLLGEVLPRKPEAFDLYGGAVAIHGDHAVVGASGDGITGSALVSFVGQAGKPLQAWPPTLSLSEGGTQVLGINVGTEGLEHPYVVFGSVTGTSPGLSLGGGLLLPLVQDAYFAHTLSAPNQAPLEESMGVLGVTGQKECYFTVPSGGGPALQGLSVYHAAVVLSPVTYEFEVATNAVSVVITH